jgi:hypothetical protein
MNHAEIIQRDTAIEGADTIFDIFSCNPENLWGRRVRVGETVTGGGVEGLPEHEGLSTLGGVEIRVARAQS